MAPELSRAAKRVGLNDLLGRIWPNGVNVAFADKTAKKELCNLLFAKPAKLSGFLATITVDSDKSILNEILSLVGLFVFIDLNRAHRFPRDIYIALTHELSRTAKRVRLE